MKTSQQMKRFCSLLLAVVMVVSMLPTTAFAAQADGTLTASLAEAKSYIDGITINSSSNDPATVVKNFMTHFTWDNEKRENSKSYLFDWSYYNGVVFEGIEYVYEVTGEQVYADYVIEYMSSLITSSGGWATCSNNSSKQCAGYNATHGADCYKTASLLMDSYEMTGDSRYLTMAKTLYADLDSAANSYSLKNAGMNYRHTWASDPSPDLWLDGLYMILPFRAEYAKYIGDTAELDLIVDRMQWVSDNMYNTSKGLFYHAADSASSNSGTYWLRSIGWYAAAIVDIMDSMAGENLEAMKRQLVKLVDGMRACQNSSNGMWLNNMNASLSSSNPYETSGTALTCYAVMKAVNKGWLDESYADMAILAFNGICNEKLNGSTLTDICFKGAPGSSNSTFYDNEGKGVGPFIMFYAEVLKYVNTEDVPEETEPEETEPEETEPEETIPEETVPEETVPEETVPGEAVSVQGSGNLVGSTVYTLDSDGVNSGEKYLIVYSSKALQNNNGVDANPAVTISNNTITLSDDSKLAWTITQSGSNYYVENNGSYLNLAASGDDPIGSSATVSITRSGSTYKIRNTSSSGAYLRYSNSQLFCAGTSNSNNSMYLYRRTGTGAGSAVTFTVSADTNTIKPGQTLVLNGAVTVSGSAVDLGSCAITWSSSNASVATVSGGTISGIAGGNTTITATLTAVGGKDLVNPIVLTIPVSIYSHSHSYQTLVTAPTCTAAGYTTYTCDCGDSYTADYTAALGHSYEAVTVDATCTADGSVTYTCHCSHSYAEVIPAKGHDYTSVVTAPTCTAAGYTTYTCHCGDTYVSDETAALGHSYETITVDATCTADGSVTYTCHCGHSYAEVIPAKGHDYTSVVTAPTCTTEGYTTYTCHCGDSYVEVIPATGHDYTSVVTAPTCEEDGFTTYTCHCGHSYVGDYTDALGHDYRSLTLESTCEAAGYTTHTCRRCAYSYTSDYNAPLGHDYVSVVTAPTCTEDGFTTHTCGRCGHAFADSHVNAPGHDYQAVVTAPTCTAGGCTTNTCINCGDTYISDETAALGHAHETVTMDATCTEDGFTTNTCTVCGETSTAIIPATGHAYESVITDSTCTEDGFTTNTCTVCGDTYVSDETAALGHTYESAIVDPTCTENGSVTYTCRCGDSYVEVIPAAGHEHEAIVTDPTCTEGGHTTYICICGDSYVSDDTAALGHSYESVIVDATCTEDGYTIHTCTACGHSYVTDETAALGHAHESVTVDATCTENGSVTYTCACGDSYFVSLPAAGHSYTCTESDGCLTYVCNSCGHSYSEIINWIALPGTYVLDTDGIDVGKDHKYIVVGSSKNYALTLSGTTVGASAVTIADNTITLDDASRYEFYFVSNSRESGSYLLTQDGSKTIYHSVGNLYYGTDSKGYWHFGSSSNGAYQLWDSDWGTWYLNYGYVWGSNSTNCFAVSSTARTVRLFKATDSYVRLSGSMSQTYAEGCGTAAVTEADILAKLSIQLSKDGSTVSGTGAVTASMLSWDAPLDGNTAGTYTASVTYKGQILGTVTVTVTPKHSFETVTTAPTCTAGGSTVSTCTSCGHSAVTGETAALGHSYTCVESGDSLVYTCGRCGHSYAEAIAWTSLDGIYILDTDGVDIGSDHKYLVVGGAADHALTHSGNTVTTTAVTVSGNTIVLNNSACEFYFADNSSRESGSYLLTQDGSRSVYHVGGNINYGHDSKGYWHIGSGSNGSYQLYDYDNVAWYLNYGYVWANQSASRFAVSSSARTVRLFKAADSYVRLTGALSQTCTSTTEAAVLEQLTIQQSTDGSTVSGTQAVTADMVTWDTAFNGSAPGTYTGTVSCLGQNLGTITVIVSG